MADPLTPPASSRLTVADILAKLGAHMEHVGRQWLALLGFIGLTLAVFGRSVLRPSSWRIAALADHVKQTGLDTIPIIALLTFLVGAVVAFLGRRYWATLAPAFIPWIWWLFPSCGNLVSFWRRLRWPVAPPAPMRHKSAP